MDSGFALYASLSTRTFAAVVNVSIRQRETPASPKARAASSNGIPSSRPTAAAASAFDTMCSPGTASCTRTSAPSAVIRNDARPSGSSETSRARTSAADRVPNVATLPGHRSAYPIATGSSAFKIASPSGPSASTGSADASTIDAHDPKTSMCATPTFVTTTT